MKQVRNMLIIDDDSADRYIYRHNLGKDRNFEWSVVEAETGEEGFAKIQMQDIDCILLDYNLPDADGLSILSNIKNQKPYVPVIFVTGQGDENVAVESMRLDAQDYIGKDRITSQALHRAVHNAMINMEFRRELDEQQAELANFARVLAHDLKEPARSIGFLMDRIEKEGKGVLIGKIPRYISMARDTSERMLSLIETLSSYTQLDREPPRFEPVKFREVIRSAIENIDSALTEKNARIIYDEFPPVLGHTTQLVQLMQNLICNGIKYCEEETPVIHISAFERNGQWIFSVSDNGIGMQAKDLGRIFEPFKRLHSEKKYKGTGLGLATCKKIVDRHGGKIWCESEVGRGSTFYFTLNSEE